MPSHTRRRRTGGWQKGDAVIVDRTSRFGNPFHIVDGLVVQAPDGEPWSRAVLDMDRAPAPHPRHVRAWKQPPPPNGPALTFDPDWATKRRAAANQNAEEGA